MHVNSHNIMKMEWDVSEWMKVDVHSVLQTVTRNMKVPVHKNSIKVSQHLSYFYNGYCM